MSGRPSKRRGYALVLVMVFVVLFTAILGVAWRRIASALRIEHVSEVRRQCDKGSIQVLAQAMKVLETRVSMEPGGVFKLNGSTDSPNYYGTFFNGQGYKITFTRGEVSPATRSVDWTVAVTVVDNASFDPADPPPLPAPL